MRRSRLVLAVFVVTTLGVTAATAVPPQTSLCPVCDPHLETAASSRGVPVTTGESRLQIALDESGDSRWTARVELTEGAPRLRANPEVTRRLVRSELSDSRLLESPRNVSADVEGQSLVVRFDEPGLARRGLGGVLVLDRLYTLPSPGVFANANRVTISGPDGYGVTATPDALVATDATVRAVSPGMIGRLPPRSFVAFAPSKGPLDRAATLLAIASVAGPSLLRAALLAGAGPALVLVFATVIAPALSRRAPALQPVVAAGLVGVTTLICSLVVLGGLVPTVGYLAETPVGWGSPLAAAVGVLLLATGGRVSAPRLLGLALGLAALAVAMLWLGGVVGAATAAALWGWTAAAALFLPLGYAESRRARRGVAVTAAVSPVLAVLPAAPFVAFGPLFAGAFLTGVTLLSIAPTGLALFLAGQTLRGNGSAQQ